jgi:hypothetical protein
MCISIGNALLIVSIGRILPWQMEIHTFLDWLIYAIIVTSGVALFTLAVHLLFYKKEVFYFLAIMLRGLKTV